MTVLLLNASYEPLAVVSWRRAITLVVTDRAEMVEHDGDRVVRSAGGAEFPWPKVVRLVRMVSVARSTLRRTPEFSKAGLAVRDDGRCQVAGCEQRGDTVDHVIARSRGGETSWENCVLMCAAHNTHKASHTLEELGWRLRRTPVAPRATLVLLTDVLDPTWEQWLGAAI